MKREAQPINEEKLNAFIGKVVGDFGAAFSSALVYIGLKLGLYKAMAGAHPVTPAELAQRTGTVERYVREWLINQAPAVMWNTIRRLDATICRRNKQWR